MKHLIARYKVKKNKIGEIKKAIGKFVDKIKKNEPGTLLYEAFQNKDNVSFVHFMLFKDGKAEEVHRNTDYCKKFVEILYPNCVEEPEFINLSLVRSNKNN